MDTSEAYGPEGDSTRHLDIDELERRLESLPPAPTDRGTVTLVVRRRADGVRETTERAHLTPESGLPDDGWDRRPPRGPAAQLAVMQHSVAELIANGQPLTLFGDNLFLDLSTENLPVGSRVRIGEALFEVTPKPHNGCAKFRGRVGAAALRFVNGKALRHRNLRGIYLRVVEAGALRCGDPAEVVSRASGCRHSM